MNTRVCFKCKVKLTSKNFVHSSKKADGIGTYCKTCCAESSARWRADNREHARSLDKAWKLANADRIKIAKRKCIMRRDYGLSPDDYERLYTFQKGNCAVCLNPLKQPNIDHNHTTGETRGLLCWICNNALGKFRDDPSLMERAANYIRSPAVEKALGGKRYGLPGRITAKRKYRIGLAKKSGVDPKFYEFACPEVAARKGKCGKP